MTSIRLLCLFTSFFHFIHEGAYAVHYYNGKVSTIDIYCYFNQNESGELSGKLFYGKFRQEIDIKGAVKDGKITFSEFDNGKITGTYVGVVYKEDSIAGTWSSPAGKKLKFYLVKTTEQEYRTALEKKDLNSIKDPDLKKLVKGFSTQTLPFTFSKGEQESAIEASLIKKYFDPEYTGESTTNLFYKGYVYYMDKYIGLILFESYEPGAFGIHNLYINFSTFSYDGKLIDQTEELGCYCNDTNMGSNDYHVNEEVVEVFSDKIIVSSTNTHATLIEEEGGESFSEVTTDRSVYEVSNSGIISQKNP